MMLDPLDRFLEAARKNLDAPAIHTAQATWTYRTLMQYVRAYAGAFSCKDAPRIAVVLPQENHSYAAFLGAGLAGGYHSPLNTLSPLDKLGRIVSRLQPDFIVARPPLLQDLSSFAPDAQLIDPAQLNLSVQFQGDGSRHDWAYVSFTSGSTGDPKGVIVSRSGLGNYVNWLESFRISPGDRVSQQPNLAFDGSITDIYGALCFGATLFPVLDEQDRMMPGHFVRKHQITVWNSTPSAISQMIRGRQLNADKFGSVRLVNFCGETLYPEQVEAVFAAVPNAVVHNTYGPTEATVTMTCARMTQATYRNTGESTIQLGDSIPGMEIKLVDGPSPDEGEAVIFGPQLAVGYWQDDQKTAEVFQDFNGRRGYRTGDWLIRKNAQLFFQERIDFQVKVRGFRIELDEVAAAIRKAGWHVAVVFKHGDGLAAVVEAEADLEFNARKLKKGLETYIEKHAIPGKIIAVDHIPRNANDKLDRKAAEKLFIDTQSGRKA